jgi:aspartyl/asparaginyl beta-hydroxylase (cupin superfamily)
MSESPQEDQVSKSSQWIKIAAIVVFVLLVLFFVSVEMDRHYSYPLSIYEMYIKDPQRPLLSCYNTILRSNSDCQPIMPLDLFPDHVLFEQHWKEIAREAMTIYNNNGEKLSAFHEISDWFDEISAGDRKWKVFMLKWYQGTIEENCNQAPITCGLVNRCPQVKAAMFSILEAGKRIPPHRGPSTGCLRYHLGLRVPKNTGTAKIRVDKTWYQWKNGEGVLFDDTFEHEVRNDSEELRIVLFMDVVRPLKNPVLNSLNETLNDSATISRFVNEVNKRAEVQQ